LPPTARAHRPERHAQPLETIGLITALTIFKLYLQKNCSIASPRPSPASRRVLRVLRVDSIASVVSRASTASNRGVPRSRPRVPTARNHPLRSPGRALASPDHDWSM